MKKILPPLMLFLLLGLPVPTLAQQTTQDHEVKISKEVLKTYLGDYKMGNDTLKILMEGDEIKALGPGYPPLKMKALKENRFFLKQFGVDIEFVKGDDGKIAKLLMIRGDGQQLEAPKIPKSKD